MKTHHQQIQIGRSSYTALVLLLGIAILAPHLAQAADGRRRRADFQDVKVLRDLVYEQVGGRSLRLDIYSPKTIARPLPAVLWIHGNRWLVGSKSRGPSFNLMGKGYIVVSLDYRLSGEAPFPAAIEDCKAAVRWLRANAATYHIDPDHIGAWGHSAGGHLAALLGTTGGVAQLEGVGGNPTISSRVQAVCDMSAPSDLLHFYESVSGSNDESARRAKSAIEQFVGGPVEQNRAKAIAASPVTYVTHDDAPILLIHGENDMSIPASQSEMFAAKLKAAGVDVTLDIAQGRGHGVGGPSSARDITNFFDKHLKTGSTK
jgi:acetyl esterase/lipase